MKLFKLLSNVDYTVLQGKDTDIKQVVIDSRRVDKNTLFVCIQGLKLDGHSFLKDTQAQGAAAAIVDKDVDLTDLSGMTIVRVADSRQALAAIAANFYDHPADAMEIIGVTGTNGKTSVTYFLEAVLNEKADQIKTGVIGTVETRIGKEHLKIYYATSTTPDTLELHQIFAQMHDKDVSHVVMEVTSHALALKKVAGIQFKVGIFTNLTQDHLDFHGSMENYKETKGQFFHNCETSIINIDDPYGEYMMEQATGRVITFSVNRESDLKAIDIVHTDKGCEFTVRLSHNLLPTPDLYNKNEFKVKLNIPGSFTVYNALSAIGAGLAMNMHIGDIQNALLKLEGVPGRIQSVPNNNGFNVIVDYAHSPDSLEKIIKSVREFTKGRVITLFGCGGDKDKGKRPIMGRIAGILSDYCVLTSDNPRTEPPEAIIAQIEEGILETNCKFEKVPDRKLAIHRAIAVAGKDDTVIIAGKGHENYQIFADRTIDFDDVEVAKEALRV